MTFLVQNDCHTTVICLFTQQKTRWNLSLGGHAWWRHHMKTFSPLLAICTGNSPVTGEFPAQRPVTLLSFICVWINSWVNNSKAGDLRRYRVHYDVSVMTCPNSYYGDNTVIMSYPLPCISYFGIRQHVEVHHCPFYDMSGTKHVL